MINFIQLKYLLLKYPAFLHKITLFCVAIAFLMSHSCCTGVAFASPVSHLSHTFALPVALVSLDPLRLSI